jgi:hypothetical protein
MIDVQPVRRMKFEVEYTVYLLKLEAFITAFSSISVKISEQQGVLPLDGHDSSAHR